MSWVYLLGKLTELQWVHLTDWTKGVHLADSSADLMVILTDAEKVELLGPTKESRLVCLLALSMAWRWVVRLECLTEMHWVQLMEKHWVKLTGLCLVQLTELQLDKSSVHSSVGLMANRRARMREVHLVHLSAGSKELLR
eukprot:scaffold8040_cov78-Skeletonema_dohrnii-CCMP3373.AAC.1